MNQQDLQALLHYDQHTGLFHWRISKGRSKSGAVAGSIEGDGYLEIKINKKRYKAHRIAFLYMTGSMPEHEIDHINGIRTDNRWSNLRQVTRKQNGENLKLHSTNSSGFRGVCFNKSCGKFQAGVRHNKKLHYIGLFDTAEQAAKAVQAKRAELFSHDHGRAA